MWKMSVKLMIEAQAESVEEEMDVLSQCTDDGRRDDDQWSDFSRGTDKDMYSVEQINYLLDETKGKAGVEVGDFFFPDIDWFISSVTWARKVSSLEELSQQKRFRLKKYITVLRRELNNHDGLSFSSFYSLCLWRSCGWDQLMLMRDGRKIVYLQKLYD